MRDSLHNWVDLILGLFASYRPGEGMKYQTIEAKYGHAFGKERLEFLFVYYNLLENGLLAQKENYFVILTEKGFEFINSDYSNHLCIYFEFVKPLSKDKDEMFANLWHLIGQKDKCLCYVDGPTYFNSISIFLPILGSYSEYMKDLHEKTGNNSRISWYKDLFYKLPDDGIESFLGKLSETYNQKAVNVSDNNSDVFSLEVLSTEPFNVEAKQSMSNKNKIFISHCGEDKVAVGYLVDLLGEVIHLTSDNLFCSSVHGFDVMLGKNFMDNILQQYKEHNLLVLYVLSFNYMGSPICLNEMGASWMTKTDSIGILLPGFDIKDLGNSCYDKQSISVIFKQDLKEQIESDKKDIQGFSWWLKKNINDIEMFNPWMFCVQRFLSQMDDFNRKIKEFNMFLKVICILNDSFKLTHDLYDDFESDEFDITTTLLIPSKQDIIDALTLFEGSTGLLPSEIALARGILKIYQEFPSENLKEVDEDEEMTFEERVIDSAIDDDTIVSEQDEITGKYYLDGFQDAYLDDEGNQVYCFFTIDILKRGNSNSRWYRENKNNMSDKLYKLYNYGILIRIGQDKKGRNIYGIGENANNRINNTNPKFLKKDVDMAMHIFHERYPSLVEEFDLFVNEQKKLNVKNTNFEIRSHLYDLEWNNYEVDK